MSQIDDVAYGLAIFKAYGLRDMGADHDVIYCYGPIRKAIDDSDLRTLEIMGWYYNEDIEAWERKV